MSSTTRGPRRRSTRRSPASIAAIARWRPRAALIDERGAARGGCALVGSWCTMTPPEGQAPDVICYEHPLNERIRTLMRLEDLYRRAVFFTAQTEPAEHHAALLALFEIVDVASRADLKTEMLQELERQRQLLAPLKHNPAIETQALDAVLVDIDRASTKLLSQAGKVGQYLRDNEWLM